MPTTETEGRRQYSAIRSGVPAGTPIAVLHIGTTRTVLASGSSSGPQEIVTVEAGSRKTADEYFRRTPPAPEELERAIAAVEDELMRVRANVDRRPAVFTMDVSIREIALLAGVPDGPAMILGIDAVERVFERMAAVTLGRPVSREGLPIDATFAATLLILREVMHHLRFASITVMA